MNEFDTYRNALNESEHVEHAGQETARAQKDSDAAAVHNTVVDHEIAARSHDTAAAAHKKAYAHASSNTAKKYHAHMAKHHEFLKSHHDSMV